MPFEHVQTSHFHPCPHSTFPCQHLFPANLEIFFKTFFLSPLITICFALLVIILECAVVYRKPTSGHSMKNRNNKINFIIYYWINKAWLSYQTQLNINSTSTSGGLYIYLSTSRMGFCFFWQFISNQNKDCDYAVCVCFVYSKSHIH